MATAPNPGRKMLQAPLTQGEHRRLRIRAIEADTTLIGLVRLALGLPADVGEADDAEKAAAAKP